MALLEFEKNLQKLRSRIEELRNISIEQEVDLTAEIEKLELKIKQMEKQKYENLSAWDKVKISRLLERPTALDYIKMIFNSFIELHGDRFYGDDSAILGGIGRLNNTSVTIIAIQKGRDTNENIKRNFGMPNPEGYRKALRLMKQAQKFNRPVICFVDTPGAYPGIGAEERGQGEAIARNLMEMATLKTPIISIVIGEGGSGGALALAVSDEVWMLEHSIYSVLSPEGFASILFKDASKAEQAAECMKITAKNLYEFEIIDKIIKEPLGGAHKNPKEMANNIKKNLEETIDVLSKQPIKDVVQNRYSKFRGMGTKELME